MDTPGRSSREDVAELTATLLQDESRSRAEPASVRHEALLVGEGDGVVSAEELPLGTVLRRGGLKTITVLGLLNMVDEFDRVALAVLGPDIQRSLNLSDTGLALIASSGAILLFAGAIPFGVLADRVRRRGLVIAISSFVWAAAAFAAAFVHAGWQLGVTRVFNGLGKANDPVHKSILADTYPIDGRTRVFALYNGANPVGNMLGPLLAGGIATVAGWRWSFAVLALPAVLLAFAALALREPERGRYEQQAVLGRTLAPLDEEPHISLGAAFARLKKIRSFFHVMAGVGALGLALFAAPTIFNLFLEDRFGLSAFERGMVSAVLSLGAALGYAVGGPVADRRFRSDPPAAMALVGFAIVAYGIVYPLSLYLPHIALMAAVLAISGFFLGVAVAPLDSLVAAVTPFRLRGVGFAVRGIYAALVGGFLGSLLSGMISDVYGERAALTVMVPFACILGGGLIAWAARDLRHDMALVAAELHEELRERERLADPTAEIPLLEVRNLDFSYGRMQVLFDVSAQVRSGEVLALLGTNGAGKSTLLRAISGLDHPDRGAVRLSGKTITYTDAEARVAMGIVQVPGGRAVFPPLTVRENLVAGAHTFMWDRDRIADRMARVLSLFPRLRERLDQPAGTMSGGEQQMLAIAKALMLDPKLLLVDELSLGLAPVVVEELLTAIEQLRDSGVTLVIVEQSLNVALALADRALFMEKGEIRFEGLTQELVERDDLARAVFLGKAAR